MTAGTDPSGPPEAPPRHLSQADVFGLGVNCVIGSGIFLLPGIAAQELGPASLLATLVAGGLALLIALCFAEASSRFQGSGGAYLYSRAAFGELVSFEVGWVSTLAGLLAWGALVKAWTIALGHFVPAVSRGPAQTLAILLFVATLGVTNLVGAKPGARLSNGFTAVKLACLAGFVATGVAAVEGERFIPWSPHGLGALPRAVLLMLYAYVGFENLVVPAGEVRDPRRSLPRAIVAILAAVTLLYLAVQAVALGTLPGIAGVENAVAEAARGFLGEVGGGFIAAGVLASVVGVNTASALILPRRLYALAEQGDLPPLFSRLHPAWKTPWVAILVIHGLVAAVALSGSFADLVILAVVARFLQYIPTCLAVLAFRWRPREGVATPAFRLPLGPVLPLTALALCGWLLAGLTRLHLLAAGGAALSGLPFYFWTRSRRPLRRPPSAGSGDGPGTS